jgi:hypothetical protein
VVIPVTTPPWPMRQRNLLDTGVTRGRKLVMLVAQPKAVALAVKGEQERRRWSKLKEWLSTELSAGSRAAAAGGLAFPLSAAGRLSQAPPCHKWPFADRYGRLGWPLPRSAAR